MSHWGLSPPPSAAQPATIVLQGQLVNTIGSVLLAGTRVVRGVVLGSYWGRTGVVLRSY